MPEAISSDRGMQFTSNVWSQHCEMLHIAHCQTIAYHSESNGAVKTSLRLQDALRPRTTAPTWAEEIPWVLVNLHAQPREDTGLSPADAVFWAPIVLPNEFLQGDEILVDTILKML